MSLYQYPVCKDVVVDSEPCWCVFTDLGTVVDDVLHTAPRIPVDRNVLFLELDAHDANNQMAWIALRERQYHDEDPHAVMFGG
jgi:hypothetical protein